MSRVQLNHEMSRFLYEVGFSLGAQFVTLPRYHDVNVNHPIERNYENSVRFLAKIPNGTAAESPLLISVICIGPTSKKISMWALITVPLFAGKSRFFYAKCPSKNILQVGRYVTVSGTSFANRRRPSAKNRTLTSKLNCSLSIARPFPYRGLSKDKSRPSMPSLRRKVTQLCANSLRLSGCANIRATSCVVVE